MPMQESKKGKIEGKPKYNVMSVRVTREDMEALTELLENLEEWKKAPLEMNACELEIANHELEAFSYTVSHDLRMPLANINGYCQVILETFGDNLDEQCKGYLQVIYGETVRMHQLISTLLRFSRTSHSAMLPEKVDLGEMANESLSGLMLAQPQRRVRTEVAEGVVVSGDASLLRVVMENLLGNAWKYTAKKEEAIIEFGVTEMAGKSVYFIRDNGAGFEMSQEKRLFAAFQRLHTDKDFEGIGIGLYTVRRIIQRHGGEVWAEGRVGMGATFYFTLDCQPDSVLLA